MITIDFVCPGCGRKIIGANMLQFWNALGKPCCSRACQRRVIEAIRGIKAQDFIHAELDAAATMEATPS